MKIYLADLGHNQLTISSDVYPLGVANLTSYVQVYAALRKPLQITIYREPQDLKAAIDAAPPDALGFSSYAWNHELSRAFARYAKARSARTLTLMGGPNFPLAEEEQERFLREMPEIDIAVRGATYESERAFLHLIRRFAEAPGCLDELQAEPIPGNLWIDRRTGEFVRGAEVERIRDLDEIPSPYLAGLMDPFLATGYFPILQITRGCPFSCSFCDSSVASNSKIFRHSVENVKADLLYIAERVRPEITLCFADDNFGMYSADEEIADYLGYLQRRFNWPRYIRTTTGKNKSERIIRVMRKVRGAMPMTAAVQSLDPAVLKNIERSNISLETYAEIQREVQSQGMQSYGELILSLPGETKDSFMRAVRDLLEAGVKRVSAHQLMLLPGAPLSSPESRVRFGFETRFRVVARNIGNYLGEPIVEVEEMVVATPTFGFEDYLEARVFHLLLTIFYYEGNFEEAFAFARQRGVRPFDLIVRLQEMLPQSPAGFRNVIANFVRESEEELFETKEACLDWARRRFDDLVDGSLGGNLLSKYSMLGRFYALEDALDFLHQGIQSSIVDSADEASGDEASGAEASGAEASGDEASGDEASGDEASGELLKTVIEYLRCVMLSAPFAASLSAQPEWITSYDVELWSLEGYVKDLATYHLPTPQRRATSVAPEQRALIESRIATFGESPSALGKFTRTIFARDLRRSLRMNGASGGGGSVNGAESI